MIEIKVAKCIVMWHNLLDVEDLVLEQLNLRKLVILKLMDGYFKEVIKNITS